MSQDEQYASLMEIGKSAYASIVEMVSALECDYDRLEELRTYRETEAATVKECEFDLEQEIYDDAIDKGILEVKRDYAKAYLTDTQAEFDELREAAGDCEDAEEARQRIEEDALSVEVRTGWTSAYEPDNVPEEFRILLATGGPAVQIIGELDRGQPKHPRLMVQDWGTPWTEYLDADDATLLAYCSVFYFGAD